MDKISFTINGERYTLSGSEVSPDTSLNDYLRYYLNLHGTKAMCHEGGCGACVVSVSQTHPVTKEKYVFAVNSCLVHILSCHQWDIKTVEGVGNCKDGYHEIQTRLAAFNGTQCGYCTPGWVMNMYSLYESSNRKLSIEEIEKSFGGNMCRCTGYRPILDAFKSFAVDVDQKLKDKLQDLEDLHRMKCFKKCERKCSLVDDKWCVINDDAVLEHGRMLEVHGGSSRWYKAFTVNDVFKILTREGSSDYRLVAGNTGRGVYPPTSEPRVHIDISSIEELKESQSDANLVLGAGVTLTGAIDLFKRWAANDDFKYLDQFYKHLELVAHVPVRNMGTIGGNLSLKNQHRGFPSDVFLLLETVQATVTIVDKTLKKVDVALEDFMKTDLKDKLIFNVKLPPLSSRHLIRTYKIMPRAQNAHAILNAGFLFKIDSTSKILNCRIVYGSVSPSFTRAKETEKALKDLNLFSDETLQKALTKLNEEIAPVDAPPEPSPLTRKTLALGLFYKSLLCLCESVNPRYKSGGALLERGTSHGTQTYDTDKSLWPLNQPIPKLEALAQCSGEVRYSCDVNSAPRDVHLAFVLSTVCRADILGIDATSALSLPGVVALFTAKDIPGRNTFTPTEVPWQESEEEILASKKVSYCGQPLAIVAATSHKLALKASELVNVRYENVATNLVLSVEDALLAPDKERRIRKDIEIEPTDKGSDTMVELEGDFYVNSQYHYTMETQCCAVRVEGAGLAGSRVYVRASTQWLDLVHVAVAKALNIPQNMVVVETERVGGAYGGKASRSALTACACAVAANALGRSATLWLPLAHNLAAYGARQPCTARYKVGVNKEGVIQYLNLEYYSDCGYSFNDSAAAETATTLTNLYESSRWKLTGHSVLTDKPSNTWCRAPATTEGTAIMEHIMERIAHATNKDPIEVRTANISPKHSSIIDLINILKNDSQYEERKARIEKFNSENAWRKRGLKMSIMSYPIGYSWNFPVSISVYHADGTILISHGGIEMGQGINTKVAQVCAYSLKVPLEKVAVRGSDSFVSPNAMVSNGSITSECVAYAVVKACEALLARLEPVRAELNEPTWDEVVKEAYNKGVNLQVSYMTSPLDSLQGYSVYGACAAEIELDVLTGNHLLTRVDLMEDTGVSMSPEIDVGQIEGAFTMGLGLWTSEQLIHDPKSGRLLTDSTWTYKPPGVRDIPVDFRVTFRRNSRNPAGVLRSKATGEPAMVLAVVVTFALHDAIVEARKEFGYKDTEWIKVGTPYNLENILKAISPKMDSFKLK